MDHDEEERYLDRTMNDIDRYDCVKEVADHVHDTLCHTTFSLLPEQATLRKSESTLLDKLPAEGHGVNTMIDHLLKDIVPGLNGSSLHSQYYGFVTGGVNQAARLGEMIVSLYDQNAAVHLPDQSLATTVEDKAVKMLLDFFRLDQNQWCGQFTTGATASNIVGLALGREYVINRAVKKVSGDTAKTNTVGASGLLRACRLGGIEDILVMTTRPHSSLGKAASVVGFGRDSVIDVGDANNGLSFDFPSLELLMSERCATSAVIVAVSCGEVNTGLFAADSLETMQRLRTLCDRYGAWLHIDGAFGLFARLLQGEPGFEVVSKGAEGIELADSIAGDGHKLLNVPYDCGFLFCRSGTGISEEVFQNANAPYLKSGSTTTDNIRSPINIGLENSRRFRGLPVYTSLFAYGREGYKIMLMRQIQLARRVAKFIFHHDAFELLPSSTRISEDIVQQRTYIIVIFRAKDDMLNESLVKRINATRAMYCSETSWDGCKATRIAVSNWQADPTDGLMVEGLLKAVLKDWEAETSGSIGKSDSK